MRQAQLAPSWNEEVLAQFRITMMKREESGTYHHSKWATKCGSQTGDVIGKSYIVSIEKGQIRRIRRQLIEVTAGNSWKSRRGIITSGKETNPGQDRREKLLTLPSPVQDYM
ncbi:hypothetical protein PR048_002047 [Dryococelus australis]|uniref:Uncharacterized protein n=1 Tax=Dryococelus australis TaxID=614101 RepID=A0ABQ9IJ31_9NEOP|nr:hypothetical protein PR048_002047 [Dryococelus australis]